MHQQARRRRPTTMAGGFTSFAFTWLLLTSGSLTSGQDDGFTEVITVITEKAQNQVTTPEVSSSYADLNALGFDATTLRTVEGNPTEETTGIQTTAPKMSSQETQTAATPTHSTLSWTNTSAGNISTTEESAVGKSATMAGTAQVGSSTEFTETATSKLSSTTQSLDTGKTSTAVLTRSETTGTSTRQSQATGIPSTVDASTKPEEDKSDGTSPATGGGGGLTRSTASDRTSAATAIIPITKPKKKTDPPGDEAKSKAGTNHGKAVAGIIGGSLLFMMVGFLVIYFKKRKLQKQKITTTDWAGPSPFLESGSNNGNGALRSSNRISLSSFLPQRLSKRLSLLPETDEEMEDMTPTTTFGRKPSENSNGQKLDGDDVQEKNGSALVVPDVKSTGDSTEVGKTSSKTNNSESTNNNSDVTSPNQNQSDNPPDQSGEGKKSSGTN